MSNLIAVPTSPRSEKRGTRKASPDRLRVCVLGAGGGGFQYQTEQILRQVPRVLDLVVVLGHADARAGRLPRHRVVSTYVVRSPALWRDSMARRWGLFLLNVVQAVRILRAERPALILAVATGQALPFALVGRMLGIPLWFTESLTRVRTPSRTGRWLSRLGLCGRFFYYWPELSPFYPKGEFAGWLP